MVVIVRAPLTLDDGGARVTVRENFFDSRQVLTFRL